MIVLATCVNYADVNNSAHAWSRFRRLFSLWRPILVR